MSDIVNIGDGIYVDEDTGEVLELTTASRDDVLQFTARRRHEAKQEEDAWKAYRAVLDQVLIKNQELRHTVYGDIECSVKGGTYPTFDRESWADDIAEIELTREELFDIALAATGFVRDALPEAVLPAFDVATKRHSKKSWVESRVVRKPAPRLAREERLDTEAWEATLEATRAAD